MFDRIGDFIAYDVLDLSGRFGEAVQFFVMDVVKITVLMSIMIFVIGYIRSYFPVEKVRDYLSGKRKIGGYIGAAGLGVLSPYCSCSTIPFFIGFVEAGIPLGMTFTFLITSPIVNEISIVLLISMFGWKIAFLYVFAGVMVALFAGLLIEKLHLEKYVQDYVYRIKSQQVAVTVELSQADRLVTALNGVYETVKKVGPYLLIGIAIAAGFHGFIPAEFIMRVAGGDNWYGPIIGTLIGVPLYSNAIGTLPVIEVLVGKGMAIGTALAFMMSTVALSVPEGLLLSRVLKKELVIIFFVIVTLGIMIIGYLFNFIL
ncbi:permease [Exiguobacterium sp. SH3S2]|uniref:permease n=1 Tax=unclassified Exiguobacterium TaxID=2644629 RepID=UPI00103CE614|nr:MULTISPECIES: permease [unclassified Exiguobacterium]TCI24451.1 permease [Exiguobacterium sp. SH5S4]TCI46292.1 permease [Exiguobacterium sp. SH3S3]TCI57019.1 permease [Exiguobacterium sp. SH5S13]TCI61933.1 permease [Exiguobacterium sp. SH3S2]TCI62804.1 permease [Exiguobacterium sp. SH3S1]